MNLLDNSAYWTKQRHELVRWLDDRAPSFTDGYVGAVRLLHTPSFPARVHLVCHVVRDIYRYLPAALGVKLMPRPAEVFPNMVEKLAKLWVKYPPNSALSSDGTGDDFTMNPQVYRYTERIIQKSVQIAGQPTVGGQLAIALYKSLDRRQDEYIHPWIIRSFDDEFNFFVSKAHLVKSLDRVPTDEGLIEHFEAFERAFHSLVGSYFSGKEELDDILQDTNETAD